MRVLTVRCEQGPVGEALLLLGRHNMRPNHLHLMLEASGYHKLTTALYPEGDEYLASDAVFGVKRSLVVVSELARGETSCDIDRRVDLRHCGR